MPELPEVETIKLQLVRFLTGHKIEKVEIKNSKTFSGSPKDIEGAKFKGARRFAKVVCLDLSNNYSILIHVKLTGQLIYRGLNLKNPEILSKKIVGGAPGPHTLVIFNLDKGGILYYNDIRRFGWIRVIKTSGVSEEPFIKKLGSDMLEIDFDDFKKIIDKTSRNIKVVLMDQTKMGGVGNIYANDALWLARINPRRSAAGLNQSEVSNLHKAILKVLKTGLRYGGASELAFVTPDGSEGEYQKHTLAYGREGDPCDRCHKPMIKKFFLGGRGTYFCPVCQK